LNIPIALKSTIKTIAHAITNPGQHDARAYKVLFGPARGTWLNLDLRTQASYWIGAYDKWIIDRVPLRLLLRRGEVAWDCGAFVGYYTALFRKLVGAQGFVSTFEASSTIRRRIEQLPILNGWSNVDILGFAVGPDHSTITFSSEQGGSSGPVGLVAGCRSEVTAGLETVQSCGVVELVYEIGVRAPDFVKFDLETGEIFALNNGQRLFFEKRPIVLLELHGIEALNAALDFAKTYDYALADVYSLPENGGMLSRTAPGRWLEAFKERAASFVANPPIAPPHMTLAIPRARFNSIVEGRVEAAEARQ
jgi:FkbM family methyltransferase